MRYFNLFFIIIFLLISLNHVFLAQNNNHKDIIELIKEADKIKYSLKYYVGDKIIGSKDGVDIAAIDGKFTKFSNLMSIMGKYFSPEAALIELDNIGLCVINDEIGAYMADGEEGFYISEDSTFEFVIDEIDIKLVKIMKASDIMEGEKKKPFYYKLKKYPEGWKIVDEIPEESIYRHGENNWLVIRSSSYLYDLYALNIPNYTEHNVFDKNVNTAWVEGALDDGIGEWVEFSFCLPINISRIGIINGYAKSQNIYEANNRVKKLKIVINSESCFEVELKDNVMDYQIINLPKAMSVERIRFIILDVYHGKKYHDTCISEIKFE